MAVFFGGRLLTTPTTASVVDDSGLANQNISVGNVLAVIGRSSGGRPNAPLRFGSAQRAREVLRSGELLDAVLKAFDPSAQTGGPSEVVAIRVNPATQATLTLLSDESTPVINLTSTDFGLYTNQIKVKIENGTFSGKKATVQFGNDFFTQDNIARRAFQVQYTGAEATAVMTVAANTLTISAPIGNPILSVDLQTFRTVQEVVDRINAEPVLSASVLDGNGGRPALSGLDFATAVDIRSSAFVVRADLQAIVDWFNSTGEGFVDAVRVPNAGSTPSNIGFTYLSGGSDGIVTNGAWSDAYTTLQQVDVQWVVPVTPNPSIHAMNDAHCMFMSTVGKSERRGIVGTASGTTDAGAIEAAKQLNSDRTSLVHLGFYDFDENGNLKLFPPYILAALLGGAFSGVNPGTPLTNKAIKVRGLERNLRNPTDTDELIRGGVLCVENTPRGFKVVQSITTWLVNENYNRVEVSTGVAVDFVARNVRDALDDLRGQKGSPILLSRAVSITESRLRLLAQPEPQGPGVIVGDDENPPYRNIRASLDADVLRVEFECQPAIGVNYVLVSIFAKAYSGTASA